MAYIDENNIRIENTTIQRYINSQGVHRAYMITPNEGYAIHDKASDWVDTNPETGAETPMQAFCMGSVSCPPTYDFSIVQVTDPNGNVVNAYGSREFYTLPISNIPENQVFGGGGDNNDHKVI